MHRPAGGPSLRRSSEPNGQAVSALLATTCTILSSIRTAVVFDIPDDRIENSTHRSAWSAHTQPERAETLQPAAAIALRVFSTNTIQGYQGDSGTVALERGKDGELSGVIEARARSVINGQVLSVTGQVRNLTIVPQKRGCGPEAADTADTNAVPSGQM